METKNQDGSYSLEDDLASVMGPVIYMIRWWTMLGCYCSKCGVLWSTLVQIDESANDQERDCENMGVGNRWANHCDAMSVFRAEQLGVLQQGIGIGNKINTQELKIIIEKEE